MSASELTLSVLDTGSLRRGQSAADAVQASIRLAAAAERAGCARYWYAEHHHTAAVIAQDALTLSAVTAGQVGRLNVGGYVLTPHRSSLAIAEHAALLEAAYPGRVDLVLGGAPGTDPRTATLLRECLARPAVGHDDAVRATTALLRSTALPESGPHASRGQRLPLPALSAPPHVWLVGGSVVEAQLAGRLGIGFHYPYHVIGRGNGPDVIRAYRSAFTPNPFLGEPAVNASAIVVTAPTSKEAIDWARAHEFVLASFRSGFLRDPQPLIEDLDHLYSPPAFQDMYELFRESWLVGTPTEVAHILTDLASHLGVSEMAIVPMPAEAQDAPPSTSPHREATVRDVADALGIPVGTADKA